MRDYSYFISILDNIDYKTITDYDKHLQYLLLSLLIYQPPVRTSYYTSCKIIRSKKENDNVNNFLLISKRGKDKAKYIINKDKSSNYKTYDMNKELSKIIIEDTRLIELLHFSYEKYNRVYLFEKNNNKITDLQLTN